jgi:YcaO-like protein with predicted kinase domain
MREASERPDPLPAVLAALVRDTGPAPIRYRNGTHRSVRPEETLDRIRPLLPGFGITRLADVTDLDTIGVPVAQAIRPNARSLAVSQGKGLCIEAAFASAAMESIELWHAEHHQGERRWADLEEVAAEEGARVLQRIPQRRGARLDPRRPIAWTRACEVHSVRDVWIPEAMVRMDLSDGWRTGVECVAVSSTGLASGNDVLEAVTHAALECIERDAAALHQRRPAAERTDRRLDLDSVRGPDVESLIERCVGAGLFVAASDITSDIGIPVFECIVFDDRADPYRRLPAALGHGCHVDREVALCRALTEALQSRLTVITGSRDDLTGDDFAWRRLSLEADGVHEQLRAEAALRRFDDTPTRSHLTIEEDLAVAVGALRRAGLDELLLVDLTDASIGIPVVRVVVPGLECFGVDAVPGPRAGAAPR